MYVVSVSLIPATAIFSPIAFGWEVEMEKCWVLHQDSLPLVDFRPDNQET